MRIFLWECLNNCNKLQFLSPFSSLILLLCLLPRYQGWRHFYEYGYTWRASPGLWSAESMGLVRRQHNTEDRKNYNETQKYPVRTYRGLQESRESNLGRHEGRRRCYAEPSGRFIASLQRKNMNWFALFQQKLSVILTVILLVFR